MPKLKPGGIKRVDLFLRVCPDTRNLIEIKAKERGVKPVILAREVLDIWAQQNTPAA
jgi:hypothetical protein